MAEKQLIKTAKLDKTRKVSVSQGLNNLQKMHNEILGKNLELTASRIKTKLAEKQLIKTTKLNKKSSGNGSLDAGYVAPGDNVNNGSNRDGDGDSGADSYLLKRLIEIRRKQMGEKAQVMEQTKGKIPQPPVSATAGLPRARPRPRARPHPPTIPPPPTPPPLPPGSQQKPVNLGEIKSSIPSVDSSEKMQLLYIEIFKFIKKNQNKFSKQLEKFQRNNINTNTIIIKNFFNNINEILLEESMDRDSTRIKELLNQINEIGTKNITIKNNNTAINNLIKAYLKDGIYNITSIQRYANNIYNLLYSILTEINSKLDEERKITQKREALQAQRRAQPNPIRGRRRAQKAREREAQKQAARVREARAREQQIIRKFNDIVRTKDQNKTFLQKQIVRLSVFGQKETNNDVPLLYTILNNFTIQETNEIIQIIERDKTTITFTILEEFKNKLNYDLKDTSNSLKANNTLYQYFNETTTNKINLIKFAEMLIKNFLHSINIDDINIDDKNIKEKILIELQNKGVTEEEINKILNMERTDLINRIIEYFKDVYKISLVKEGIKEMKTTPLSQRVNENELTVQKIEEAYITEGNNQRRETEKRMNKSHNKLLQRVRNNQTRQTEDTGPIMSERKNLDQVHYHNLTGTEPLPTPRYQRQRTPKPSQESGLTPEQAIRVKNLIERRERTQNQQPQLFDYEIVKDKAGNPTSGGMKPKKKNKKSKKRTRKHNKNIKKKKKKVTRKNKRSNK